jgi:hypothetical protein
MTVYFKLARTEATDLFPYAAERLAEALRGAARRADKEGAFNVAVTLYLMAADAFDAANGVTVGHNRADRYRTEATRCRTAAQTMLGHG